MTFIGVTGHRPKYYNDMGSDWIDTVVNNLERALIKRNEKSPITIITGMALGWDQVCAEVCLNLQIPYIAYLACKGQHTLWGNNQRNKFKKLLDSAKEVKYISNEDYPHSSVYFERDRAVVDSSSGMLALYKPGIVTGGTYYTITYAQRTNKPIKNFWI